MKNSIILFLFLIPAFLFAQYPTTGNKSRLGWQTTGDGLIWRGVAGDTVNKPNNRNYPYFQLDTVNSVLYRYIQTRGKWQPVSESVNIDSLIYATRYWVNSNFFPLQGGLLTGTGGNGFVGFPLQSSPPSTPATGFSLYAGSTGNNISWMQPDGFFRRLVSPVTGTPRQYQFMARSYTLADSADIANNVTSIAANYLATSNGTNLVARNLFDDDSKVEIKNGKPLKPGQWTTAGRPSGVTGYTGYNTTLNYQEFYDGSTWFPTAFWAKSGTTLSWGSGSVLVGATSYTGTAPRFYVEQPNDNFVSEFRNTASVAFAPYSLIKMSRATSTNGYGGVFSFDFQNSSSTYVNYARFGALIEDRTAGSEDGSLVFYTTEAGATIQEKMRIISVGDVGIGTTTPSNRLHVTKAAGITPVTGIYNTSTTGTSNFIGTLQIEATSANAGQTIYTTFGRDAATNNRVAWLFNYVGNGSTSNRLGLAFFNGSEMLTAIASGRIGINKIAPDYTLDVTSTNAYGLARGTVAQRPTIASSTTPFRYNTDSTAIEYGESVGTWRQLATRAYARSLVASATWLKPQLESVGNVKISTTNSLTFKQGTTRWTGSSEQLGTSITPGNIYLRKTSSGDFGATLHFADTLGVVDNDFYFEQDNRNTVQTDGFGAQLNLVANSTKLPGSFRWAYGVRVDTSSAIGEIMILYGDRFASTTQPITHKFVAGIQNAKTIPGFDFVSAGADGKMAFRVNSNINLRQNGKFFLASDSTFSFDPSTDLLQLSQYGGGAKTATALSKTFSTLAGFATDGTVLNVEQKRDTTIYVTDADYNFSAAITSANILKRYNNVVIYSKLSASSTSDNQIFLHTPSSDFLQCTIIIYSNDASADSDATSIDFTVNGAVDGAGGAVSSYGMSPGQRVNIRAVDDGGYKWFFN